MTICFMALLICFMALLIVNFSPLRLRDTCSAPARPSKAKGDTHFSPLREGDTYSALRPRVNPVGSAHFSPLREGDTYSANGVVDATIAALPISVPFAKGTPTQP